jgi:methylmalonyl-CoA mutase cobalamin-binding subunit
MPKLNDLATSVDRALSAGPTAGVRPPHPANTAEHIAVVHELLHTEAYGRRMQTQSQVFHQADALPCCLDFTRACQRGDIDGARAIVDDLLAQGTDRPRILEGLVAPAARTLGLWWEEDACSFADVTCGATMLREVIHHLSQDLLDADPSRHPRALLCTPPRSDHMLGVMVIASHLVLEQIAVVIHTPSETQELLDAVANEHFDVIGVSVAVEGQLYELKALVQELRAHAGNPTVPVVLGGAIFALVDANAELFGADAIAHQPMDIMRWIQHPALPAHNAKRTLRPQGPRA